MYYPPNPHYFYRGGPCRSGPSRLVWFFIGAGVTFWWLKHREARSLSSSFSCMRYKLAPPPPPEQGQNPGWPQNVADIPRAVNGIPPANAPSSSPPSGTWPPNKEGWKWDPDREHMEKVSRQAVDAMIGMTESTLESVLSTAESLKVKLAEHRAARERQQQVIERQLEEQRKNPPRLV